MNRKLLLFTYLSVLLGALNAQSELEQLANQLLDEALAVFIDTSVVQSINNVDWKSDLEKLTIPGRPVTVNLSSHSAKMSVHLTPYLKDDNNNLLLVAQSEIWLLNDETSGFRYFSSLKSIPLEFDESVDFFPLGKKEGEPAANDISIRMSIKILPYNVLADSEKVEWLMENKIKDSEEFKFTEPDLPANE